MARVAKVRLPRMAWALICAALSAAVVLLAFAGVAFASEGEGLPSEGDRPIVSGNLVFATIAGGEFEGEDASLEVEPQSDKGQAETLNGASAAVNGSDEGAAETALNLPPTGEDGLVSIALAVVLIACSGFVLRCKLV